LFQQIRHIFALAYVGLNDQHLGAIGLKLAG